MGKNQDGDPNQIGMEKTEKTNREPGGVDGANQKEGHGVGLEPPPLHPQLCVVTASVLT